MLIAVIISATGVMITLGKLIYGEVTDRIGGCRSSLLFGGDLLLGYMLCCLAFLRNTAITGATVLALGIGYPIATIGPSVWANDMSSPDRYPTVIRRLQVFYAGGALVFASVPGILAYHFGSYLPAYMLFSAFLAAALLFIALAYRETKRNEMI